MATKEIVLAKGDGWDDEFVVRFARRQGYKENLFEFFRIEHLFSLHAERCGAKLEWSIRYAEVTGDAESLQFDIDKLRNDSILDWLDRLS